MQQRNQPEEGDEAEVPAKGDAKAPAKAGTAVDTGKETPTAPEDDGFPTIEAARTMKSGELGRHYKNVKLELAKVKSENTKLKAKSTEANPEVGKLTETVKQYEERMKAQEETLRYVNFEQSDEYKTEYWAPYEKAYQGGYNLVGELQTVLRKDDLGEITQERRDGTAADFDKIVNTPKAGAAAELAETLFGPMQGGLIMRERAKVLEANAAKEQAKDKYKKEGGEIFKKRQEAAQAQQREVAQTYWQDIKTAIEKRPEMFGPVEGDEVANKALEKGFALADEAFSGIRKNPDGSDRQLTPKEHAQVNAAVRNQAGAFGKVWHQLKQAQKMQADLEAKLKEFQASEPKDGDGAGKTGKGGAPVPRGAKGIEARMAGYLT